MRSISLYLITPWSKNNNKRPNKSGGKITLKKFCLLRARGEIKKNLNFPLVIYSVICPENKRVPELYDELRTEGARLEVAKVKPIHYKGKKHIRVDAESLNWEL